MSPSSCRSSTNVRGTTCRSGQQYCVVRAPAPQKLRQAIPASPVRSIALARYKARQASRSWLNVRGCSAPASSEARHVFRLRSRCGEFARPSGRDSVASNTNRVLSSADRARSATLARIRFSFAAGNFARTEIRRLSSSRISVERVKPMCVVCSDGTRPSKSSRAMMSSKRELRMHSSDCAPSCSRS